MYPDLKYLYFLLVSAACFLSSCASDVLDSEDVDKGAEMTFTTAYQPSRAVTTSFDKFIVYGDMTFLGTDNESPVLVFDKTQVQFNNGKWTYDGAQFWFPKHEHSFVAVSPVSAVDPDADPRYSASALSFSYSLPAGDVIDTDDITDILVATHRRLYVDGNDPITLKFSHIMSLLNFAPAFADNVLSDDDYILFHRIELSGVDTKARFEVTPAQRLSNDRTDDMVVNVTPQLPGNFKIVFAQPVKVYNHADNINLFDSDDQLIMIPQTFAAGSDAKINFVYSINNEADVRLVSLPLGNRNWESGNSYIYKFTIERSGLVLDKCEINPWNEIKGDEIIVD